MQRQIERTTEPIQVTDTANLTLEFGRCQDLQRVFGLKRGSAYNLLAAGKIRGCVIRIKGQKSGLRLFDMASVRNYIRSQFGEASK
jgi:hypothetical protein